MYLLLSDETNLEPSSTRLFFIYGGLAISQDKVSLLHERIDSIRQEAGYNQGELLKFDTNSRPKQVTREGAREAKRRVVQACLDFECTFFAYVVHHKIVKGNRDRQLEFAISTLVKTFDDFLIEKGDTGLMLVDTLPGRSRNEMFAERFHHGLKYPRGYYPVPRIQLYGTSIQSASHLSSAVDIVLGTFRYCVNNPEHTVATKMIVDIVRLMWGWWSNGKSRKWHVMEHGLVIRPKTPSAIYSDDYDDLRMRLSALLKRAVEARPAPAVSEKIK